MNDLHIELLLLCTTNIMIDRVEHCASICSIKGNDAFEGTKG